MSKNDYKIFFLCLSAAWFVGCQSIGAKSYVEVKDRVDQDVEEGNAGYLMGAPGGQDQADSKRTRKVYVFEFTKKNPQDKEMRLSDDPLLGRHTPSKTVSQNFSPRSSSMDSSEVSLESTDFSSDTISEENIIDPRRENDESLNLPTEYTVQENDTLQTISKKFYQSYSKWPRIYEANKDKLGDPNRIYPGLTLTIPKIY